ncbi:ankyrin repeat-containing domain protein [Phyllosticta citribraziliensis]|uniref:Ankyrin repeat-containing domain protein n=1 Tax=Phyllosticta citribraziliensis TaxID=989973 RepID=A0ABR1L901_9PEZI
MSSLWDQSIAKLSEKDQRMFRCGSASKREILNDIVAKVEEQQDQCLRRRWKTKGFKGREIVIRDVCAKFISSVKSFLAVVDTAVSFDPVHAAFPWAGIRFLLQFCMNSTEAFDAMIEGLEKASDIIARCTIMEKLYLPATSDAQKSFETQLSKLYGVLLSYLCEAMRYYKKSFIRKILADTTRRQVLEDALKDVSEGDQKVRYQRELIDAERTTATLTITESNKASFGTMTVKVDELQVTQKILQQALKDLETPFVRIEGQIGRLHNALEASERSDLLKWLSAIDFRKHHEAMISGILPNTGEWLLTNPEYASWKSSSSSEILWLHGTWGCGKSRLAAVMIEDLEKQRAYVPQAAPIAYFYCCRDTAEPQRANCEEILRAIVKQLSVSKTDGQIAGVTVNKYKNKVEDGKKNGLDASPLTKEESVELILQLTAATPATIVIDGLDECDSQQRGLIMSACEEIVAKSRDLVKILVSSREEDDIKMRLGQSQEISVTAKQNHEDLGRFIKSKAKDFITEWGQKPGKEAHKLGQLENDIISALEAGAQGMFLWVTLQLETIRDTERIKLDEDVRAALRHLPAGLIKSFDAVYARITSLEQTAKTVTTLVLKWLLCAQRPLSVEELIAAVSRSIRADEAFSTTELLDCCCGLVVLDSESDVLRLSHTSVREYLESLPEFDSTETHSAVTGRCLGAYIWDGPSKDLLVDYATVYWPIHCEAVGVPHRDAVLKAMLLEFFTKEEHFEDWLDSVDGKLQSQEVRWHGDLTKKLNALSSSPPSPLFTISCFGLSEVLQNLSERGLLQDLELLNKHDASGLYLAAHFGHEDVVKGLIGLGCNVSAACGRFGSAIKAAAFFGHCSIVKLLLDHHAATDFGPGDFANPLQASLAGGHEDIIEALLRSGFRFSTQDEFNDALQFAGFKGHAQLVEHLLQGKLGDYAPHENHDPLQVALHGRREKESKRLLARYADINAEVGYFGNALQAAIAGGKLSLVQLVHQEGASLGSRGRFGYPLRAAAIAGKDDVLVWLLDQGADPNVQDDELGDALQAAASKNHISTMSILLEHGANPDGHGGFFKSTMQAAAYAGHQEAIKLLLQNKASIKAVGRFRSVLQAAIHARNDDVVDLLLQKGAPVDTRHRFYVMENSLPSREVRRTLPKIHDGTEQVDCPGDSGSLELAARYGNVQLIQKFIDMGAKIDAADDDETYNRYDSGSTYTALQIAAFWGHRDAVICLLDNGANISAKRQTLGTPLQAALEGSRLDIASLLLERGAPIDQHWGQFGSCLQVFCERDNLEVVRFLLEHGADIEDTGGMHGNAIQVASDTGHLRIVRFLLENGARIDAPGKKNGNALQAAAGQGNLKIVKFLIQHGANVNAAGEQRGTALQNAVAAMHVEMVKYLLDEGAEIETADGGFGSPLQLASYSGQTEVVQILLERGADIHSRHDLFPLRLTRDEEPDPTDALFAACKRGHASIARQLFRKDPWGYVRRGTFERTAEKSAKKEHLEISSMLISEGASVGFGAHIFGPLILNALKRRSIPFLATVMQNFPNIGELVFSGRSLLEEAAYQGEASTVASLLAKGTSPASRDAALTSAIAAHFDRLDEQSSGSSDEDEEEKLWSTYNMDEEEKLRLGDALEVLRVLVEAGADVTPLAEKVQFFVPMIFAEGSLQLIELLDRRLCIIPQADSPLFREILQLVSSAGKLDIVKYLISKVSHPEPSTYAGAIKFAASRGQKHVVEYFLSLNPDMAAFNTVDDNALKGATSSKSLETMQLLLREIDHDAPVFEAALALLFADDDDYDDHGFYDDGYSYDNDDESPEHKAQRLESLLKPLSRKTDVGPICTHFLSNARRPLLKDPLTVLLTYGADPNAKSAEGQAPLYQAAKFDREDQVKVLLDFGADPNPEAAELGTALHIAARKGALGAAKLLIEAGADVNHIAGLYGSALTAVISSRVWSDRYIPQESDIQIAEFLVENGADVDAQGGFFGSALQAAASGGNEQAVKFLLEKGADPSLKGGKYGSALKASRHKCSRDCQHADFEGLQGGPFCVAKEKENIAQLLIDAGASDSE